MPVRHSPPRSLAQRIMLSFALLVTFVAGFYAFALYQSIEFTEQQLISGILRDEVARAVDTLERGETPRLPEDTRLYGAPPLEAPPPAMRGLLLDMYETGSAYPLDRNHRRTFDALEERDYIEHVSWGRWRITPLGETIAKQLTAKERNH